MGFKYSLLTPPKTKDHFPAVPELYFQHLIHVVLEMRPRQSWDQFVTVPWAVLIFHVCMPKQEGTSVCFFTPK